MCHTVSPFASCDFLSIDFSSIHLPYENCDLPIPLVEQISKDQPLVLSSEHSNQAEQSWNSLDLPLLENTTDLDCSVNNEESCCTEGHVSVQL